MQPKLSFPLRFACVSCGIGPLVFAAASARQNFDLLDHLGVIVALMLILWVAGTAWVIAARSADVGGFGNLSVADLIIVPVATFFCVFGTFFLLMVWAMGHMH